MCRIYTKDGKPDYVRACYKTGQPGMQVPIDQAIWNDRDHLVIGKITKRATKKYETG